MHFVAVDGDLFQLVVKLHAADDKACRPHAARAELHVAAQLALDTCEHLNGVERLGDVVVRTDVQPEHLVGVLALGGQQNDGHVAFFPQTQHSLNSVKLRHHNIKQDKVNVLPFNAVDGLKSVKCLKHPVPICREVNFQCRYYIFFVVANEYVVHLPSLLMSVKPMISLFALTNNIQID